jgi:hypothetical protein
LHFLGSGDGPKFLKGLASNPDAIAKDVVGEAAANSNPNIFFEKGINSRARTLAEVWGIISKKQQTGMTGAVSGYWGKGMVSQDVANIPQLALGGIASGPQSGYLANLHGREAVLPLPNGDSVPIALNIEQLTRSITDSFNTANTPNTGGSGIVELLSAVRDMVTLQRDQNDLVSKLLQVQRA